MVQRYCNPNHPEYPNYGGRWISIFDEYRHDFLRFLNDIGVRQNTKFSLGRINLNFGFFMQQLVACDPLLLSLYMGFSVDGYKQQYQPAD